jgi:hypothetical protein
MARKYYKTDASRNSINIQTNYIKATDGNIPAMPKENFDYLTYVTKRDF